MERTEEALARANHPSSDCVVASGRGFAITMSDVNRLRRSYVPSPDVGAATRLAVDVWLAEWIGTGKVGRTSIRDRIVIHQRLVNEEGAAWPDRLAGVARELDLQHGPCYVPRAEDRAAQPVSRYGASER